MPVYNAEAYLSGAIGSILGQTFNDFEFLIVNDNSTDETEAIIKKYMAGDGRIRLANNKKDKGIVGALNTGLEEARGQYIARMDADDVSLPHRLAEQVRFMDDNREVGVCGTWMNTIEEAGSRLWFPFPADHEHIKIALLFYTPIAHPTVLMRRSFLEQHGLRYEETFKHVEDYELWERCAHLFRLANLPQVLFLYRLHPASVGKTRSDIQAERTRKVKLRHIRRLGIEPTEGELAIHSQVFFGPFGGIDFVNASESWLLKLIRANRSVRLHEPGLFEREMYRVYFNVCLNCLPQRLTLLRRFFTSRLHPFSRRRPLQGFVYLKKLIEHGRTGYLRQSQE
jgi:glycosyltransferase involved in cell wall biosynthesis